MPFAPIERLRGDQVQPRLEHLHVHAAAAAAAHRPAIDAAAAEPTASLAVAAADAASAAGAADSAAARDTARRARRVRRRSGQCRLQHVQLERDAHEYPMEPSCSPPRECQRVLRLRPDP